MELVIRERRRVKRMRWGLNSRTQFILERNFIRKKGLKEKPRRTVEDYQTENADQKIFLHQKKTTK